MVLLRRSSGKLQALLAFHHSFLSIAALLKQLRSPLCASFSPCSQQKLARYNLHIRNRVKHATNRAILTNKVWKLKTLHEYDWWHATFSLFL